MGFINQFITTGHHLAGCTMRRDCPGTDLRRKAAELPGQLCAVNRMVPYYYYYTAIWGFPNQGGTPISGNLHIAIESKRVRFGVATTAAIGPAGAQW